MELLIEASKLSGQPLSVLLIQYNDFPDRWRETLSHIINANEKSKENHSHAAHKEIQEHFSVKNSNGEILGFYSKNHQGIFTHKGSYFHLHFVDSEEFNMGHVEGFSTKKNVQLLLPKYKTK